MKKKDILLQQVTVDNQDKYLLDMFSWFKDKYGYCNAHIRSGGHIKLHHLIIGKPLRGLVVDHKNGNKLDNRRSNLHIVTKSYNSTNRKRRVDSLQKYKGVQLLPSGNYRAKGPRGLHLGTYKTAEEAYGRYLEYCLTKFNKPLYNA